MVRLASSVAPRILTLSDKGMTAPATLTDLSPDRDLSLCDVPNKIATDLFGLCHKARGWQTDRDSQDRASIAASRGNENNWSLIILSYV